MSVEIGSLDFLFTYPIRNLPVKAKIKSLDVGFENDKKACDQNDLCTVRQNVYITFS